MGVNFADAMEGEHIQITDNSRLGRVGQRLLLRVVLLAPNQIIVRLNLGPRIALGEVKYRLKIKGTTIVGFWPKKH